MKEIPLTQGKVALVDDSDFDAVSQLTWCVTKRGDNYYAVADVDGVMTYLHRFLLKPEAGFVVDHISGDGLDCRRGNMRICTQSQNMQNQRRLTPGKASQFKGVYLQKRNGRYFSLIKALGKRIFLGTFTKEADAAHAYDDAAHKYFGDFARLNFPANSIAA